MKLGQRATHAITKMQGTVCSVSPTHVTVRTDDGKIRTWQRTRLKSVYSRRRQKVYVAGEFVEVFIRESNQWFTAQVVDPVKRTVVVLNDTLWGGCTLNKTDGYTRIRRKDTSED